MLIQEFSNSGFDDIKADKQIKRSYEVDFKVHSVEDLEKAQEQRVEQITAILGLPQEQSALLLRHFKWNKERLVEKYVDASEKVLRDAGLQPTPLDVSNEPKLIRDFSCAICCDEGDIMTFALPCNHRFCKDCYGYYVEQKIVEEGESRRIQCPGEKCGFAVDEKQLRLLVTPSVFERHRVLLDRTYVDDHDYLRWCPSANCEYAIECAVGNSLLKTVIPTVECACAYRFCFGCGLADHQPCLCALVKLWLKKCADDSETANWISANTKECPKCNSTIEKNGGCNHIICRKCKHEFCWVCMGPWSEHGSSWYSCNRFEEKSSADARDGQAKSRATLDRYLHYYNRYANHEQSAKLEKDQYSRTEKRMHQLQSTSGLSWIEVQYLHHTYTALQQCRQTLKWTYALAFYLKRNNLTDLFEDNQRDLEMAVEQLSELFEKPLDEMVENKRKVMDKTAYVNNRRQILLEDTCKGLAEERWPFSVEL